MARRSSARSGAALTSGRPSHIVGLVHHVPCHVPSTQPHVLWTPLRAQPGRDRANTNSVEPNPTQEGRNPVEDIMAYAVEAGPSLAEANPPAKKLAGTDRRLVLKLVGAARHLRPNFALVDWLRLRRHPGRLRTPRISSTASRVSPEFVPGMGSFAPQRALLTQVLARSGAICIARFDGGGSAFRGARATGGVRSMDKGQHRDQGGRQEGRRSRPACPLTPTFWPHPPGSS